MSIDGHCMDMASGITFPPVAVFYDGTDYWLADGFHRYHAASTAEISEIEADVRQGSRRDAVLFSVGTNASHGLRRTNADKRRAVDTLLRDDEWSKWSDREIARRCTVSHNFVNEFRRSLSSDYSDEPRAYTTKHGTVATMQTANIGKSPEPHSILIPRDEPDPVEVPASQPASVYHADAIPVSEQWHQVNNKIANYEWYSYGIPQAL